MSNENTTNANSTVDTSKLEKPLAPAFQLTTPARVPFEGTKPKDKITAGKGYVINSDTLTPHPSNARLELSVDDMVHKIRESRRIEQNLWVMIRGSVEPTIEQVLAGTVPCVVLKGHRRLAGVKFLQKNDPAFYEEFLKDRIPVQFVLNPTEDEELVLLHDHSGTKGLNKAEIVLQFRALLKSGKKLSEIIDIMMPALCEISREGVKIKEVRAQQAAGIIDMEKERAELHKILRGNAQTFEHIATCPQEVFDWYLMCNCPELALKRGVKVKALSRDAYNDIAKVMKDTTTYPQSDARIKAALALFEKLKAKAMGDAAQKEADKDPSIPVVRSMSKQELEKAVPTIDSPTFRTILEGVAGSGDARDRFPAIDAMLTLVDAGMKAYGARFLNLLENPGQYLDVPTLQGDPAPAEQVS